MMKPILALGFAAALMAGTAYAQTTAPSGTTTQRGPAATTQNAPAGSTQNQAGVQKASKADQAFLKEAVEGDMAEVKMGQLAQQNGQSQDVKSFGQMLQQDHGQHLQQAQQQAQQMGVTPPSEPNAKQKAAYDRLSKMSGAQFDKAFAKDMVKDHKEDIAKYQKEAKSKGPLANFAQQTVPVLQKHLQTAQSLENAGAAVGSGNRNAK
jgi:putative membrane protein